MWEVKAKCVKKIMYVDSSSELVCNLEMYVGGLQHFTIRSH